jgi:DNA-binding NarL/FixJ family response regulator
MLNVLIVEDEPIVAVALRDLLRMDGRCGRIDSAVDLRGALAIAQSKPLDVAFVDISLANGSSGYSVASELTGQHVRCVFVTGMSPPFAMPEFAVGCLAKPFTAEAVASALDAAASRSRASAHAAESSDAGFLAY